MAKAKTIKAEVKGEVPVLKVGGSDTPPLPSESSDIEHVTVRGKMATYVMEINMSGLLFNAYIIDNEGNEYDVDADINPY